MDEFANAARAPARDNRRRPCRAHDAEDCQPLQLDGEGGRARGTERSRLASSGAHAERHRRPMLSCRSTCRGLEGQAGSHWSCAGLARHAASRCACERPSATCCCRHPSACAGAAGFGDSRQQDKKKGHGRTVTPCFRFWRSQAGSHRRPLQCHDMNYGLGRQDFCGSGASFRHGLWAECARFGADLAAAGSTLPESGCRCGAKA